MVAIVRRRVSRGSEGAPRVGGGTHKMLLAVGH